MCIIIIKQKEQSLPREVLESSARINPHGLGVLYLDTFKVEYHQSQDYKVLFTKRPFIAHFRLATIGKITKENTHPFVCGVKTDELLFMNGTIPSLGNKHKTDTQHLADNLGRIPRHLWKTHLSQYTHRFVSANIRNKTFQIYNRDLWVFRNGVWYSKDNVLEDNLVAVYGTLKKGLSNYHRYLNQSTFVGAGETSERYPLNISGLPYLYKEEGVGHNVEVDVFRVSNSILTSLDGLEGHPNWYKREKVEVTIRLANGMLGLANCWVYFMTKKRNLHLPLHKTYKQVYEHPSNEDGYCSSCYNLLEVVDWDYYCTKCKEILNDTEIIRF